MGKRSSASRAEQGKRIKLKLKGHLLSALIFIALSLPFLVLATAHTIIIPNPLKAHTFEELIYNILVFIWWICLALFPLMIVIGGFYFVTAAGNPAQIEKGKGVILYASIGLLIIMMAWAFVQFFKQIL